MVLHVREGNDASVVGDVDDPGYPFRVKVVPTRVHLLTAWVGNDHLQLNYPLAVTKV